MNCSYNNQPSNNSMHQQQEQNGISSSPSSPTTVGIATSLQGKRDSSSDLKPQQEQSGVCLPPASPTPEAVAASLPGEDDSSSDLKPQQEQLSISPPPLSQTPEALAASLPGKSDSSSDLKPQQEQSVLSSPPSSEKPEAVAASLPGEDDSSSDLKPQQEQLSIFPPPLSPTPEGLAASLPGKSDSSSDLKPQQEQSVLSSPPSSEKPEAVAASLPGEGDSSSDLRPQQEQLSISPPPLSPTPEAVAASLPGKSDSSSDLKPQQEQSVLSSPPSSEKPEAVAASLPGKGDSSSDLRPQQEQLSISPPPLSPTPEAVAASLPGKSDSSSDLKPQQEQSVLSSPPSSPTPEAVAASLPGKKVSAFDLKPHQSNELHDDSHLQRMPCIPYGRWTTGMQHTKQKSLEGEMLFIMNKLTPTNFGKMASEMKKLDVRTYDDLKLMVNVFFDKVMLESNFVEVYAQLCKVMSGLKVVPPSDGSVKEHMATFRVVILTRCLQEFQADKSIIFEDPKEKKKKLEALIPEITPERDEMIECILYQMMLNRLKYYGNIRFLGELFKLGMLTESIMHDCIFRLLKAKDDFSLASLYILLTVVGSLLDTDKAKPRMDQYFSQLKKIADERKLWIRFLLLDVIDLRQNKWIPRNEANKPIIIVEEQAYIRSLASHSPPIEARISKGRISKSIRERKYGESNVIVGSFSEAVSRAKMIADQISKNVAGNYIQLDPRCDEKNARPSMALDRSFMGERYQIVSPSNSWRTNIRVGHRGLQGERDKRVNRSDSGVDMWVRNTAPPAVEQMTKFEIESKAKNIIDEYLNSQDLAETKLCMKELSGQRYLSHVTTAFIYSVIEKADDDRINTGNLLNELVGSNILTSTMYIEGLREVLRNAIDLLVDVPKLWSYLAQLINPLLVGGSLQWSMLKMALSPHLDNKNGAMLLAEILSQCTKMQGEKEVVYCWQNRGLSWSDYLKTDEVTTFLNDQSLGYTLGEFALDLEQMIRDGASSQELIDYIQKSVSHQTDNSFIRALTKAVISASITESKRLDDDIFKAYKQVFYKFLSNNVDLQLQALYAVQTLMAKLKHPSGVICRLFELFYFEVSVDKEAFYRWETCRPEGARV